MSDVDDTDEEPADLASPARRHVDPRTLPARISHLKAAARSGAHCLHSFQDDADEGSLARRLGSGAHALLLGQPCALWDQPAKSGKGKAKRDPRSEAWKGFVAAHPGAVILNAKEMDAAQRMVDAIRACPSAARLLAAPGLVIEQQIIWSMLGRSRRSTPDLWRAADQHGPGFVAEIKTTRCAEPFLFGLDARKLGYHAQLADQSAAIEARTGKAPRHHYIIAVESVRPHVVQVYEVPRTLLEDGAKLVGIWLERLQVYEITNLWGGYSDRIETLEFPERSQPTTADPSWSANEDSTDTEEQS